MHALDHGAEQRFLGLEVVIQRLPRQACCLRRLLDRGTAKAVPAEHRHGSFENAVARAQAHLTTLTLRAKVSNDGVVPRYARRDSTSSEAGRPVGWCTTAAAGRR